MLKNVKLIITILFLNSLIFSQQLDLKYSKIIRLNPVEDSSLVYTGLDLLVQNKFKTIKNKKVAVVFGSSSYTRDGRHILDIMKNEFPGQLIVFIQVLESEIKTQSSGLIFSKVDPVSKTKVLSITPDKLKIRYKDVKGCNILLYDLQDTGIRESTPIVVLIELLKLSAKSRIPLIILDRPNPINARVVEGPISNNSSVTKGCPLPIRHGLTIGELAIMINEEKWLDLPKPARLYVIPMFNYKRSMWYDDTGISWKVLPKKLVTVERVLSYCGLFFAENTNLSYGGGTYSPYEIIGAPWISGERLVKNLDKQNFSGVKFSKTVFTPGRIGEVCTDPIYLGRECSGVRLKITDRSTYEPILVGSYIIAIIAQFYPHHFKWLNPDNIDSIFGSDEYRMMVELGGDVKELYPVWIARLTRYQKIREQYFLYKRD